MGIILASGGSADTDEGNRMILSKLRTLSGKADPKVVILPTARFDTDEVCEENVNGFLSFGFKDVKALKVSDENVSEQEMRDIILSSDIVYATGGNLKHLMEVWTKRNFIEILREAFDKNIVLGGSSSGAMCWFDMGYDDCGENGSLMFVPACGFLPFCNCPHFDSPFWQQFEKDINTIDMKGIATENGCNVIYNNGKYELLDAGVNTKKYAYLFDGGKKIQLTGENIDGTLR